MQENTITVADNSACLDLMVHRDESQARRSAQPHNTRWICTRIRDKFTYVDNTVDKTRSKVGGRGGGGGVVGRERWTDGNVKMRIGGERLGLT